MERMSTKKITIVFQPLNEKKNFEKIVDVLKEKIFSGEFHPGDRLPVERDLAEALKVSRLSVREAYRALELFGMVEIRRGNEGGAFIRTPSSSSIIQSVSDLFRFQGLTLEQWTEARLLLELDISRLAIKHANARDCACLEALIDAAYEKIDAGLPAHDEHIHFHTAFAEMARNPILFTAYNSMMDLLLNSLKVSHAPLEHAKAAAEIHRRIVEALKNGDINRLSRIIKEHVKTAGKRLLFIAEASPLFNKDFSKPTEHPAKKG
jgi:GntR family transcriptional repressor for pyruvate dehydrogenase complex